MILQDNMILYHGSYTEVKTIDLSLCAEGKDFGKGFYLTSDFAQASRFVKTAVAKALKNGVIKEPVESGFVSSFRFTRKADVSFFEFEEASRKWLHCVAAHRHSGLLSNEIKKFEKLDVITGKIANDTTNQVITAYMNGLYGAVGSEAADSIAISLLLPNKLSNQICFRSESSLRCLTFIECKEVPIRRQSYETK